MRTPFRQGIVKAPASFLVPTGGTVSLNIAPLDHALVTFADGDANYLIAERQSVPNAWSGPFTAGTDYWLYWDINNRTGVRTFGYTLREPVEGNVAPLTPAPDQHWFDTANKRMKVWNATSGQWVNKIRVFAAKLQAGSVLVSMSYESPAFTGTQVGLFQSIPAVAGALVFDINGDPVRRSNGTFFTTEDAVTTGISSAAMVKLGSVVIDAVAAENIPAYSIVRFSDFHQIELASNYVSVNGTYGLIEMDATTGAVVNVVMEGVITNPNWDWSAAGVNAPLFSDETGQLTTIQPPNGVVVATVIDTNTILLRAAIVTYTEGQGVVLPTLTLQEEGVTVQEEVTVLNVVGANVTATAGAVGTGIITVSVPTPPSLTVEEEGSSVQTNVTSLNFVGANVTAAAGTAGEAVITVSVPTPPSISLSEEGVVVQTDVTDINFVGANVTVTAGGAGEGVVTVSVPTPPSLAVQEEGSNVQTNVTSINFVGASVTATAGSAGEAIVTFTPPTVTPLEVQDDAVVVDSDVNTINFGTGITVTPGAPGAITVSAADPVLFDQDLNTTNSVQFVAVTASTVTTPSVTSGTGTELTTTTTNSTRSLWWSIYGDTTTDVRADYISAVDVDSQRSVISVACDGNPGDVYVLKQDIEGNRVWEVKLITTPTYYLSADDIAVDSNDDIYVTATINNSINGSYVTKISSAGSVVWSKLITPAAPAGSGNFYMASIDSNAGVVALAGVSNYLEGGTPSSELSIIALNATTGAIVWQKALRQSIQAVTLHVDAQSVRVDDDGNVYVLGTVRHPNATATWIGEQTMNAVAAIKYNAAGVELWSTYLAPTDAIKYNVGVYEMDVSHTGYVAISYFTQTNVGNRRTHVTTLDSFSGDVEKTFIVNTGSTPNSNGTTTGLSLYGLRCDGDVIYVTGSEEQSKYWGIRMSDFATIKFDRNGAIDWGRNFGSPGREFAFWYWGINNLTLDGDRYIISGYTSNYGQPTQGDNLSNGDGFVAVLPTDGSLTGTYNNVSYYATPECSVELTSAIVSITPAPITVVTNSLSVADSGITVTSATSELITTPISPATLSWKYSDQGIETPRYTLPLQTGSVNQSLVVNEVGAVEWTDVLYDQSLNSTSDVKFESVTTPMVTSDVSGDFQINVIDPTSPAWWAYVGDITTDTMEDYTSAAVFDNDKNVISISADGNSGLAYVMKQSRDGARIWQIQVVPPQAGYVSGDDVGVDAMGNVYFVAVTEEAFFSGVTLFKVSGQTGGLIWARNFSDVATPRYALTAMDVSPDGDVILSGKFGPMTNTNMKMHFVKLDTDGNYVWSRTIEQAGAPSSGTGPYATRFDQAGNVYTVFNAYPSTAPNPTTYFGIAKISPDGALLWLKTYSSNQSSTGAAYPAGLTIAPTGKVYAAMNIPHINPHRYVMTFLEYSGDINGAYSIQAQVNATWSWSISGLECDSLGYVYISGETEDLGGTPGASRNFTVIKAAFETTTPLVWARTIGTGSGEYTFWGWNAKNIDVNDTSFLVSGYTYGANGGTGANAEGFISVWPTDGTLTGTYGEVTYSVHPVATITPRTGDIISTAATTVAFTDTAGTDTSSVSTFAVAPYTNELNLTVVRSTAFSWEFSGQGIVTPNYTLPFVDGTAGQTLVTNGAGAVTWQTAGGGSSAITYTDATKNLYVTTYSIADPSQGTGNVALGNEALIAVTTGSNNVSVGSDSLKGVTISSNNISLGTNNANSFDSSFRGNNIIIGNDNGPGITTYDHAVVIGNNVQAEVEYASVLGSNIFIDDNVGSPLPSKPYIYDSFVSANDWSLYRSSGVERSQVAVSRSFTADSGTIVGSVVLGDYIANESLADTGRYIDDSVLIGPGTGYAIVNSTKNIAITYYGFAHNTTGQSNIAIGEYALEDNTTGSYNVAVGYWSQFNSTAGEYNAALGAFTLQNVTTGSYNSAVGNYALGSVSTGTYNDAQGSFCLNGVTTGQYNVGMGGYALNGIGAGSNNVGVGYGAGLTVGDAGFDNAFVGYRSVAGINTSAGTVAVGCETAYLPSGTIATTTDCVLIGKRAGDLSLLTTGRAYTNVIVIGAGIQLPDATVSNTIYMGNSSITAANIPVAWTVTSDARDKTDIIDLDVGLEFVNQLRPRKFKLMNRDTQQATTGDRYGLVTQEILEVDQTTPIVDQSDADRLRLNETMMIPVLINAIQELSAQLNELKAELNTLKGE